MPYSEFERYCRTYQRRLHRREVDWEFVGAAVFCGVMVLSLVVVAWAW